MTLIKEGFRVRAPWGHRVRVDVYMTGRHGSMAPTTYLYKWRKRWITPLERRIRGWEFPIFNILLHAYLPDSLIREEILKPNSLFQRIGSPNVVWSGAQVKMAPYGK